jgi:tetratricopeptide (TPR) repeat protein
VHRSPKVSPERKSDQSLTDADLSDLSRLQAKAGRALAEYLNADGTLRQTDILRCLDGDLKPPNPMHDKSRGTGATRNQLTRFAKLGLGTPVAKPRGVFYTEEDALTLLMALALWKWDGRAPGSVVRAVQAHFANRGQFTRGRVAETLAAIALDRFRRLIAARLFAIVLRGTLHEQAPDAQPSARESSGPTGLPEGSVALWHYLTSEDADRLGELEHGQDQAAVMEAWVRQLVGELRRPVHGAAARNTGAGIVAETGELLLADSISQTMLAGNTTLYALVPEGTPHYLVVAKIPGSQTVTCRRPRPAESQLVERLLDGLAISVDQVGADLGGWTAELARDGRRSLRRLEPGNVLVWMLTRLVCHLCHPGGPRHAAASAERRVECVILEPQPNGNLLERVASDVSPYRRVGEEAGREHRPRELELDHPLSGYAAMTNLTLSVSETRAPYDKLVYAFEEEAASAQEADSLQQDREFAAIAVPIVHEGSVRRSVLYTRLPRCNPIANCDAFQTSVRTLQVLGPILGELLDRERGARNATLAAAQPVRDGGLEGSNVAGHLDELKRRLRRSVGRDQASDREERLALVVVKAVVFDGADHDPNDASTLTAWLDEQIHTFLQPDRLLIEWRTHVQENNAALADAARSSISFPLASDSEARAIFIPFPINKRERDWLRLLVATRLSALPPVRTNDGKRVARLAVWIVDEMCRERPYDEVLETLVERATQAERQLAYIVEANQHAYLEGDWGKALSTITRAISASDDGLEGSQSQAGNPYLHRKSAEFYLREGRDFFVAAEQHARAARDGEPKGVTAYCLLGDTLLVQGRLAEAMKTYNEALAGADRSRADVRGRVQYSKAFALLLVAEVLRQHAHDRVQDETQHDVRGDDALHVLREVREVNDVVVQLAKRAAVLFTEAKPLWQSISALDFSQAQERRRWVFRSGVYGPIRAEVLAGRLGEPLLRLDESAREHPRDDLVYREQLWIRMWRAGLAPKLIEDLTRDGQALLKQVLAEARAPRASGTATS